MFGLSFFEMSVIGIIAVVLFGGNLPEVARKFGGTYSQIRRSLMDMQQQFRDAQRDIDRAMSIDTSSAKKKTTPDYEDDRDETPEPTAPKFKPPQ